LQAILNGFNNTNLTLLRHDNDVEADSNSPGQSSPAVLKIMKRFTKIVNQTGHSWFLVGTGKPSLAASLGQVLGGSR
jgi:hypothetical protein